MTDKVIKVNVTATKKQSVNISAGNVQNQITATPDSSQYYSNLSKNWAIGEGLIQGVDYSSKTYAEQAKIDANNAKSFSETAQNTYINVQEEAQAAITNINTSKETAISAVNTAKDGAVNTVNASASNFAKKDLSNLSTVGQAKFDAKVNKSGDTMTGNLNINKNSGIVNITGTGYKGLTTKSTDIDYTLTDQASLQGARIISTDKNGQWFGYFQSGIGSGKNIFTSISARRMIDGTAKECIISCNVSNTGGIYTSAPTPAKGDNSTKIATTAWVNSTVNAEVIVVTETYINGTSGYRVWSDGYCEQWGRASWTGMGNTTITLLKAYSNTNYNIMLTPIYSTSYPDRDCSIVSRTTSKFVAFKDDYESGCDWQACGYLP
jgi:hypothetical protein